MPRCLRSFALYCGNPEHHRTRDKQNQVNCGLLIFIMSTSSINIDVTLDRERVPEDIRWNASDSSTENARQAKAMMLAFWDGAEKTALRIDLWTKEMMVDEMADFFYQTLMTMAETYQRATQDPVLMNEMKQFARDFYKKFQEQQLKTNKLQ